MEVKRIIRNFGVLTSKIPESMRSCRSLIFLLCFLCISLFVQAKDNPNTQPKIFTEDLFVKDFRGNSVNLKNLAIRKDTVVVFAWCKTCGACIRYLNYLKSKNYQLIAVAITENDSIEAEKKIAGRFQWNFDLFYDSKSRLVNFLYKKDNFNKRYLRNNKIAFGGFPNIYLFINGVLVKQNTDKYINPAVRKQ